MHADLSRNDPREAGSAGSTDRIAREKEKVRRNEPELATLAWASTGLLTGQAEHGLGHPTLEAVVVHELLEQFGIILD